MPFSCLSVITLLLSYVGFSEALRERRRRRWLWSGLATVNAAAGFGIVALLLS